MGFSLNIPDLVSMAAKKAVAGTTGPQPPSVVPVLSGIPSVLSAGDDDFTPQSSDNVPPPSVSSMLPAAPKPQPPTPPPDPVQGLVNSTVDSQTTPKLAKQKPTLMQRIAQGLSIAGTIGGGLEAAGNRGRAPGADRLLQAREKAAQLSLEKEKLETVDQPMAQAHEQYYGNLGKQFGMVPYTYNDANGEPVTVMVQQKDLGRLGSASITGAAGIQKTQVNKRFITVPNVGLFDTQSRQMVPGSAQGITITPEIAQDYGMPKEFVGRPMSLSNLAAMERATSFQEVPVQGANGPALVNRKTKQVTPLGLGNPGVASRQAGVVDTVDENGQIVPQTEAQRLRSGNSLASTGLAVGKVQTKIYDPAIEADTRLKQMYQQATDVSGASDQALLFNHIAMTGGQVKGLRMGEYLTEAHRKARGIPEDIAVMWNRLATGESLSPQQRLNFVHLAEQVRQSRWDAARRQGALIGVGANEPAPDPDLPELNQLPSTTPTPRNSASPPQQPMNPTQKGKGLATSQGNGSTLNSVTPKGGGTGQHKIGDTVTLKGGKTVKISKVYPDGSFDAQ